jgi:hypothetical protein
VIILLRSLAFNALFYLNTLLFLIAALPTFFMPYRAIVAVAKSWGRVNLVLRAWSPDQMRGSRPRKIARGPAYRRFKASIRMGNLCVAAVARQSRLHPQA